MATIRASNGEGSPVTEWPLDAGQYVQTAANNRQGKSSICQKIHATNGAGSRCAQRPPDDEISGEPEQRPPR
jgi:hypothetical protein